ncbi:MAG: VWA domain-containing protein [Acidobacteria bacterium]|nr:VWA domain-containing protein [Acidobacteriota bacterium]
MNRREFLSAAAAVPALAQQQQAPDPSQTITLEVNRVNILFTVSDRKGRFVNNLMRDEFEVYENKKKQKILEFVTESNIPLRLALLVDTSNSIRNRFRFEVETASQFLASVVRPEQDRALIFGFDTAPYLVQGLTNDTAVLGRKLRDLRPGGGTALFETIFIACRDHLGKEQPKHKFRRALILIGDGEDNSSHFTRDQALEMAHKTDTLIYAISTNMTKIETDGDKLLKYFCSETGGLAFFPFKAEDLAQDFENIANELRSQYSILYRPEPLNPDGKYHTIQVKVRERKDVVVRARKGYYADGRGGE